MILARGLWAPRGDASIVDLLSLVLRVALGGFKTSELQGLRSLLDNGLHT